MNSRSLLMVGRVGAVIILLGLVAWRVGRWLGNADLALCGFFTVWIGVILASGEGLQWRNTLD